MPQLLILQPLLWVVPLITTSSRPRLSSAFRFKRRQGAAGAGNSPSVSEGVAEGRGSNMSVKIPCVWLASLALNGSLRELFMSHRNHGNHRKLLAARVNGLAARAGADGVMFSAAGMPQLLILQPLLWVVPPHNNVFQAETLVGISFQTPAGRCRRGEFPFCFRTTLYTHFWTLRKL